MVGEDRVRYAMELAQGDAAELAHELARALGFAWDDELEPYRAGRYADVVPLTRPSHAV
jgi:2-polyprenyl-6-methoxyphenol hydroxylase-like FAD-dependent oxidoreductase